jgi:CheY-like chemotaxis protein
VIKRVFQHLGYTMTVGNNGMEALKIIEEQGMPDMIVMDVQMYVKEEKAGKKSRNLYI